ncbi:MAG: T9SS type A sorting domain-containing protein, partial [Bacteroidia bacterium]|nr:T9SS type A sorting domain-containing protein [Bacteroidia bacterium]
GTPTSSQYSRSIDIDNSGNLYITGRVHETSYFDSISVTSFGGADVFIAKLHEEPVSVEYNGVSSTIDISVFPNPAADFVNVKDLSVQPEKAELVSTDGKVQRVYNQDIDKLDVSNLQGGVYMLRLYTGNVIFVQKVVIY